MTINLFSLLIGIFAGAVAVGYYLELRHMKERMEQMRADQVKALPHGTLNTLDDIRAVVNDLRWQDSEVDSLIQALIYANIRRQYNEIGWTRIEDLVNDIR